MKIVRVHNTIEYLGLEPVGKKKQNGCQTYFAHGAFKVAVSVSDQDDLREFVCAFGDAIDKAATDWSRYAAANNQQAGGEE